MQFYDGSEPQSRSHRPKVIDKIGPCQYRDGFFPTAKTM